MTRTFFLFHFRGGSSALQGYMHNGVVTDKLKQHPSAQWLATIPKETCISLNDGLTPQFKKNFKMFKDYEHVAWRTHLNNLFVNPMQQTLIDDMKVIHLIRDCRNQIASTINFANSSDKKSYEKNASYLSRLITGWKTSVRVGLDLQRTHPDKYKIIRFEDLMENPVSILDEAFQFAGLTLDKERVDSTWSIHKTRTAIPHSSFDSLEGMNERWKIFSPQQLDLFNQIAINEMRELKYLA